MLTIVNEETQTARSFRLTIGLVEGYSDGKLHTQEEVGNIIVGWLESQHKNHKPYLPGSITAGAMYYYARETMKFVAESVAFHEGDVSPEYNAKLTNGAVITALQELAEILAIALNQTRIYLRYDGVVQILERTHAE